MSPSYFDGHGYANEFYVYSTGDLLGAYVGGAIGLRPVVSLKLGTSIAEGDGTGASPYIVK